ncbi:MAG: SAM-dependent methyltransferase [Oscillospiraceae bacterium]|nr:SAM-dependent methyltransferase [Oscillospiraceae bacterium]
MKVPLSPRLLACCDFVHSGDRVADVGCDHGYLGIYLLSKGIASKVIASDINEGPLKSAIRNSEKFGVRDKISFCLSDGVRNIPRDFDTMVCAGMGGDTMVSILEAAPWLKSTQYRLILQCQSKTPMLRQYLAEQGWCISEEIALKDGRFLYTVMEVTWQPGDPLSPGQCYFSPALLKNPSTHLSAYYNWIISGLRTIVDNQKENADPFSVQALYELTHLPPEFDWLKEEHK